MKYFALCLLTLIAGCNSNGGSHGNNILWDENKSQEDLHKAELFLAYSDGRLDGALISNGGKPMSEDKYFEKYEWRGSSNIVINQWHISKNQKDSK